MPNRAYRADDFLAAAARAGAEVVLATDRCHVLDEKFAWPAESIVIDYHDPEGAAATLAAKAADVRAVVATEGETPALVAALVAERLGLPGNPVAAARAARDKHALRAVCAAAGVPVPRFALAPVDDPTPPLPYPCVLKPRFLSASRGVIRADEDASFAAAHARVAALLAVPEVRALDPAAARAILVEEFIPGAEVALEGLLVRGALEVLALFDKPDPLDGPFFEETLYVTPSRHAADVQRAVADVVAAAARAMGLVEGPVHAELRLGPSGPVLLEVAARAIGGLCGRILRFGAGLALEDVIMRHALGQPVAPERERASAGVMMLPIPARGILRAVDGIDAARAHVDEVVLTARLEQELVPLPEGDSYLGFLFARGKTPEEVEARLRRGHGEMRFTVTGVLPVR
jgi:biotin carboxylase